MSQVQSITSLVTEIQLLCKCPRRAIAYRLASGGYACEIRVPSSLVCIDDNLCTQLDSIDSLQDIEFIGFNTVFTFTI